MMMKTCHQGSTSHQNHLFGHLSIDLLVGMMTMVTMVMMVMMLMIVMMGWMVLMVMVMMMMVMMVMVVIMMMNVYSNLQKIFHPCNNRCHSQSGTPPGIDQRIWRSKHDALYKPLTE